MTAQPDYPWWVGQSGPLVVWAWENCPEWRAQAQQTRATIVRPPREIQFLREWAENLYEAHISGQTPVEEEFAES